MRCDGEEIRALLRKHVVDVLQIFSDVVKPTEVELSAKLLYFLL